MVYIRNNSNFNKIVTFIKKVDVCNYKVDKSYFDLETQNIVIKYNEQEKRALIHLKEPFSNKEQVIKHFKALNPNIEFDVGLNCEKHNIYIRLLDFCITNICYDKGFIYLYDCFDVEKRHQNIKIEYKNIDYLFI